MTAVQMDTAVAVGTQGDVVASLLTALQKAYLGNDIEGAETLATQILMELGDDAVAKRPKTAANARLLLGWAMMNRALRTPRDLTLLAQGVDEIASVHHVLLERDDMVVERVTAECYMAFGALLLGNVESCDGRMELLKVFIDVSNDIQATTMYLQMSITIRRFKGEDVDFPVLPPRENERTEELTADSPTLTEHAGPQIMELDAEHRRLIAEVLEADDPERMIDIITPLIDQDPARLTAESWFAIEHAHVWAHFRQAFSVQNLDERTMILKYILPYAQRLIEMAQVHGNTGIYIPVGMDLVFALYSLGEDYEAQLLWVEICTAVHAAQDPHYQEMLDLTQSQIAEMHPLGSRPLQAHA